MNLSVLVQLGLDLISLVGLSLIFFHSADTSKPPVRAKIRLKYSHSVHFITGTYD